MGRNIMMSMKSVCPSTSKSPQAGQATWLLVDSMPQIVHHHQYLHVCRTGAQAACSGLSLQAAWMISANATEITVPVWQTMATLSVVVVDLRQASAISRMKSAMSSA